LVPGPFGAFVPGRVCLKNVGSRGVDLTASVIDLVDTDNDCTGDETVLDATCGDDQVGELSPSLLVSMFGGNDCTLPAPLGDTTVATMETTGVALPSLAPDQVQCVIFLIRDAAEGDAVITSQSDTSEWRFAFDATAT
jgi:hypothetical protein